jgi:REP element-mobilizing transposase RayT
MVIASHVVIGTYGFWLPNDERGSWSDFVGSWELLRFGKATTVRVRRSLARRPFDPVKRAAALAVLKYPPVVLTGLQARAVARGFADYAAKANLAMLACAILPRHVHLVLARHRLLVETLVNQLKGSATRRLIEEGNHPLAAHQGTCRRPPKAFARGEWKVFLNSPADIERAIRYVEGNPQRENLPAQTWWFVRPFVSADLHPVGWQVARSASASRLNNKSDHKNVHPRPRPSRSPATQTTSFSRDPIGERAPLPTKKPRPAGPRPPTEVNGCVSNFSG